ncbi:DNA-processing protein DprA [Acanthopleuribacter pedis]|uniref:DNA-processing protein DprA n=1 Tax=Acanthopleuribacter pedis TaxID=442870 RepID=A0A8J7Q0I9_9BACT|nr:DNA-processing protein DprA [Acanthopleuribacter pedis]MBO1318172.1 DNA-processing protein DprA [Acanthopleuribacter pedis]
MNDLRRKLILAVSARGPLALLRAYQQHRMEHPGAACEAHLARAVEACPASGDAEVFLARCRSASIEVVTLLDDHYPALLRPLEDPPLLLFYRGDPRAWGRPCTALVGARACSNYGAAVARRFAVESARRGVAVVSGLALGIDGFAHDAAVSAGGCSIAVLGSGLNAVYPRVHRPLGERLIAAGGCLISEFPPDAPPKPYHFPIRNRIISGLCRAVVVVEAALKSGSLITARHCLDQGRELFAVPGPIDAVAERGTHALIRNGEAQLLDHPDQLFAGEPLTGDQKNSDQQTSNACFTDPLAKKIYLALDAFVPLPLDRIRAKLDENVEIGLVIAKLCELEAQKWVESYPGQCYLRNPLRNVV